MKERLYLFDTTLRDGAQTLGVDFSVEDKLLIAQRLDALGIDYIEGGYPGANPVDTAFFDAPPRLQCKARGLRHDEAGGPIDLERSWFPGCRAGEGGCDRARRQVLGLSRGRRARRSRTKKTSKPSVESVEAILVQDKEPIIDCEHFFDGYKANPAYALACARAAYEAGARWVVLCDTNGGTLPHEVEEIVAAVAREIPSEVIGIHAHNDTENGVANTLAAVRAGACQIHGTLNGLGERCGNANLTSIIPTLLLKEDYASKFDTGVTPAALRTLRAVSRQLDELLNRQPDRHAPYVGESAFAHKGGIHASAVAKDPRCYEHVAAGERRERPQAPRFKSGGALEHPGGAVAHRHGGRQRRPAARRSS